MPKPATAATGVAFPLDAKGARSSTAAGKAVFMRAAKAVEGGEVLAAEIEREKDWRHKYVPHLVAMTRLAVKSKANALSIAKEGLACLHETFEFVEAAEATGVKLQDAMTGAKGGKFFTGSFKGSGSQTGLEVPLGGCVLSGAPLDSKIDQWVEYGCIEADAAAAIKAVNGDPSKAPLKGHCFVMIGAGSEMGPFRTLMQMGATVVGTGTRRASRWTRVFDMVRDTPGELLLPLSQAQGDMTEQQLAEAAGCDLNEDVPELLKWISSEAFKFSAVTIGCYVYMDGEAHVRAALAMDLLVTGLVAEGKSKSKTVSVAYLGSPATVYPIPKECQAAMAKEQGNAPFWQKLCVGAKANAIAPEGSVCLCNGLAVLQGPNYALAKTMQMWRAILLREDKVVVSSPMAPACRTASMMSSASMSAFLDGQAHFKPLVSFDATTASPLLAALLLHDLFWPDSSTHPSKTLENPNIIFALKGFHGGLWRCAWSPESVGTFMAVLGKVWRYHPEGL